MQSWTFKPLCMHSNSLLFFKIGLLHLDSFNKYGNTALWHWTQSVMKCASIKKLARKDFNGQIQNLSTFIALCLESHWLSWDLYLACFQLLQRKEFFPSYVQCAWNNLGYEEEWIQPICISLIHRYGLEKPRFWQLFVHYFDWLQAVIAALPKSSNDDVPHTYLLSTQLSSNNET